MKIDLTEFRETFLQESADHLASMEADLLALRSAPSDSDLLNSIFRSAHTIKGGAGLVGYSAVVHFTHSLENLLNLLREGELEVTENVIEVLLRSVDVVRTLSTADPGSVLGPEAIALKEEIDRLIPGDSGAANTPGAPASEPSSAGPDKPAGKDRVMHLYRVSFEPHQDLFASGTNPIVLLRNLADLGTVSCCHLHQDKLPSLADLDPEICYLGWTVELACSCSEAEVAEVFEFVEGLADIAIERQAAEDDANDDADNPVKAQPAAPVEAKAAKPSRPEKAEKPSGAGTKAAPKKSEAGADSIRVSTEKVDRLIDLVGELVIAHVMTAQMVEHFDPSCLSKLREAVAAMERSTRELHERVMSVRMLPVGMLFQRYPRAVYDIARATGKQIRLEMSGEETEIDRSMLEALGDPMIHLIRNAADHGIESPEERKASGKPEEGLIWLRAFHRSGRIIIEIADDGAGIDVDRVRRKAIERGLIRPDCELTDEQVRMLIFEPGFSTREQISDLSGRGVGMDVVRQGIRQLNGVVSLTSEKGQGTKLSIELPLTLAILEGLLVRVTDRTLVLPLLSVVETVPLPAGQIERVAERGEVILIREEPVPLLRLSRFLGLLGGQGEVDADSEPGSDRKLAVIVQAGDRKVGFVVDELLGQQQVVVKSLEKHLHKVEGLMGATILGDGCVAPIVDVCGVAALDLFGLRSAVGQSRSR